MLCCCNKQICNHLSQHYQGMVFSSNLVFVKVIAEIFNFKCSLGFNKSSQSSLLIKTVYSLDFDDWSINQMLVVYVTLVKSIV